MTFRANSFCDDLYLFIGFNLNNIQLLYRLNRIKWELSIPYWTWLWNSNYSLSNSSVFYSNAIFIKKLDSFDIWDFDIGFQVYREGIKSMDYSSNFVNCVHYLCNWLVLCIYLLLCCLRGRLLWLYCVFAVWIIDFVWFSMVFLDFYIHLVHSLHKSPKLHDHLWSSLSLVLQLD